MIGVVVVSDRGDLYLPDCMRNLDEFVPHLPRRVVDDSDHRLGLAGAAQAAWNIARDENWEYLLHWEEDFRTSQPLPLLDMQHALERFPNVSQIVLKRQPWSTEEKQAGGIIEMHPDMYEEASVFGRGYRISLHRRIFSLNPCLIPRRVLELGWPKGNEAEMTAILNEDPENRFAFYGGKADPPRVEHVGAQRSAQWCL